MPWYFDTHPHIYIQCIYTYILDVMIYWTGNPSLYVYMYKAHYYFICWPTCIRVLPSSVLTKVRPSAWSLPPRSPPNQHYQPSPSPRSLQPHPKSWCRSPAKSNQSFRLYVSAWTYNQQCCLLWVKLSWEFSIIVLHTELDFPLCVLEINIILCAMSKTAIELTFLVITCMN